MDQSDRPIEGMLDRYQGQKAAEFAGDLVRGVVSKLEELDGVIAEHSTDWAVNRMPVIDKSLLRVGAYELLHDPEIPAAVVINEAVELAKEFSTEDSGSFINGVLAS